jgi:8-oxo-dGTP diphosphatase
LNENSYLRVSYDTRNALLSDTGKSTRRDSPGVEEGRLWPREIRRRWWETGVKVLEKDLQRVGHLTFLFPAKPDWSQVVHAFLVTKWDGNPMESTEMIPAWFASDDIPFEHMWQDVTYWLPRVLAGEQIRAHFTFNEDNETVHEVEIEPWNGGEE